MINITLDQIIAKRHWLGFFAIAISAIAWTSEFLGAVYICPYCRVQRSVIGLLGLILILPFAYHWLMKYSALVLGFFGAVVASNQHFMGWKKISSGKFKFNENILIDPFLLSAFALTAIIGMVVVILKLQKPH